MVHTAESLESPPQQSRREQHQCPMDDFRITKRLRKALIDLGYMTGESGI